MPTHPAVSGKLSFEHERSAGDDARSVFALHDVHVLWTVRYRIEPPLKLPVSNFCELSEKGVEPASLVRGAQASNDDATVRFVVGHGERPRWTLLTRARSGDETGDGARDEAEGESERSTLGDVEGVGDAGEAHGGRGRGE